MANETGKNLTLNEFHWKVGRSYNYTSIDAAQTCYDTVCSHIRSARTARKPKGWSFGHHIALGRASHVSQYE